MQELMNFKGAAVNFFVGNLLYGLTIWIENLFLISVKNFQDDFINEDAYSLVLCLKSIPGLSLEFLERYSAVVYIMKFPHTS